ncbi:uncharacterized protein K489DRAFT_178086 [Dissoconium aciculare CBS 342.82]|uniref:Uncharacterized protein n=1 Tax=Dissoconium aciculare CBS 342.82 TaxID=1314786 RepID=A0A6J3M870_9PEZI|nr:uncharacterized protein K489DRAFT_178086 [Dissoconium aciculare CBS 342.82]KAF1824256.1 hypothetical protein K489DRAFT_178086 [Dissoconium aciculare CBS 342.82]
MDSHDSICEHQRRGKECEPCKSNEEKTSVSHTGGWSDQSVRVVLADHNPGTTRGQDLKSTTGYAPFPTYDHPSFSTTEPRSQVLIEKGCSYESPYPSQVSWHGDPSHRKHHQAPRGTFEQLGQATNTPQRSDEISARRHRTSSMFCQPPGSDGSQGQTVDLNSGLSHIEPAGQGRDAEERPERG